MNLFTYSVKGTVFSCNELLSVRLFPSREVTPITACQTDDDKIWTNI